MGLFDAARVDVTTVLDAAQRYDTAAELLDGAVRRCLAGLTFGGARAGREYGDGGDEVRRAVVCAVDALRSWSQGSHQIASQIRVSAADYAQIDERAAGRMRHE